RVSELAPVLVDTEREARVDHAVVLLPRTRARPVAVVAQERVDEAPVDPIPLRADLDRRVHAAYFRRRGGAIATRRPRGRSPRPRCPPAPAGPPPRPSSASPPPARCPGSASRARRRRRRRPRHGSSS